MTDDESRKVAEDFVINSSTFVFDGIKDTPKFVNTSRARFP